MKALSKIFTIATVGIIGTCVLFPIKSNALDTHMQMEESDSEESNDISPRILNGLNNYAYDASDSSTVTDVISYQNLPVGKTYSVTGTLYEVSFNEDGEIITTDTGITGTTTFTVDRDGNEVEVSRGKFVNSGSQSIWYHMQSYGSIGGKTFVAKEILTLDKNTSLRLFDVTSERFIRIPDVTFSILDANSGLKITSCSDSASLVATVDYSNLNPGTEYSFSGKVVKWIRQTTYRWVPVKGADGNPITVDYSFVANESNGSFSLPFSVNTSLCAGVPISLASSISTTSDFPVTVFEQSAMNHSTQSVQVVKLQSSIVCESTNTNVANRVGDTNIKVTTVLSNFIPNETYEISLALIDDQTNGVLCDSEGNQLSYSSSINIGSSSKTISHTFSGIDNSSLGGHTISCKTVVKLNDVLFVPYITGVSDNSQKVFFPTMTDVSLLLDDNTPQVFTMSQPCILSGSVTFAGLAPGKSYKCYCGYVTDNGSTIPLSRSSSGDNFIPEDEIRSLDIHVSKPLLNSYLGQTLYPTIKLYYGNTLLLSYKGNGILVPAPTPTPGPTSTPTPSPTPAPTPTPEPAYYSSTMMVWIPTNGGHCYHTRSSCSGMRNPEYVTVDEACAMGFRACRKCC